MRDPDWRPSERDVVPIGDWGRLLDGKVAVVTGGGDGIGAAVAMLFARHGAAVEMAEIDPDRAERSVRAIREAGGTAHAHVVDVTRPSDVDRLAEAVLIDHRGIDVLVNNVGDYRPFSVFESSGPDDWKAMYDVNAFHIFCVTRAFLPSMIERGGGSIVNVHSVEALRGYAGDPVYGAMKAAAAHFTTCLAVRVAEHGIRVNGIGPDMTQTSQVDYLGRSRPNEHLWATWSPIGRLGWPEDQARAALFLASDLSGFITGVNVPVDGGTRASSRRVTAGAARAS